MKIKPILILCLGISLSCGLSAEEVTVSTKGGLSVKAGEYSFKVVGRLQFDYNYTQLNDVTDEDTFDARRARLSLRGRLHDFAYRMDISVDEDNGGSPVDLHLTYNGWGNKAKLTMGRQKMLMGLDRLSSSKDNSILERSALTERHTINHQYGIQLHGANNGFIYGLSLFEDNKASGTDDFGYGGRLIWNPLREGDHIFHLGGAYFNRGDDISTFGLESAYTKGPVHLQAEYFNTDEASATASGYYLQAGWVLTGEKRPYNKQRGSFKRVKPKGPKGAWELVVRYEDGDGKYDDIELGLSDSSALGLGVNLYLNNNVRLGVNYTFGENNDTGDEGSEFRIRTQLTF